MSEEKFSKKILKAIEQSKQYLDEGEVIEHAIMGTYEADWMGQKITKNNGLFLATNKKVFFFAKRMTGYDSETFPYSNISSFESGKKMLGHYVRFFASGNKVSLKWIQDGDIGGFITYVKNTIQGGDAPAPTGQTTTSNTDVAEEIKKLAELKEAGILTEEEFQAKKKQLLGI